MKKCPKCASLMPDDVSRCIRCGFDSKPPAPVKRGRIRNGWALARQSLRVLMLDKELLVFPLLSGIACFLVLAGFVAGAWASGVEVREESMQDISAWVLLFVYYFANYFVIVFFNSALVACAMIRFRGGNPTVRDGLRAARERLHLIAAWALLAATVGVVLRAIEERVPLAGKIAVALLGAAWTIATYFVVPVLVVEKLGPIDAAKRSAMILKKAWGESIVSNAGVGLITFLVTLLLALATGVVAVMLAISLSSLAVALAGLAAVLVLLVLGALIGSALGSIVLSALYVYATENRLPEAFDGGQLQAAFVAK